MIYFYHDEVSAICNFLNADIETVWEWLKANKETDKYIEFEAITPMGQTMYYLIYGKNKGSKTLVKCQVSYLGTHFQEN